MLLDEFCRNSHQKYSQNFLKQFLNVLRKSTKRILFTQSQIETLKSFCWNGKFVFRQLAEQQEEELRLFVDEVLEDCKMGCKDEAWVLDGTTGQDFGGVGRILEK